MLGGGRSMGGGAGGESVLRVVGRAITKAGFRTGSTLSESISSSGATSSTAAAASTSTHMPSSSNELSISSSGSSPFSPFSVPLSANSGLPNFWPSFGGGSCSCCDEFEWVSVDGSEDERALGFVDDFVLGPVPSADEVQYAISALQQ